MESVNAAFMKVSNAGGKRVSNTGVSILFAAGDQGVWGREGPGLKYHPDFPAGRPT
ncbi:C2 domain-containing protein [Aureococcus anophagefferens]|nr:C2 domain-containing protein [Aureococcus anophagefferens]